MYLPRFVRPSLPKLAAWNLLYAEEAVICTFLIAPLRMPKARLQIAALKRKRNVRCSRDSPFKNFDCEKQSFPKQVLWSSTSAFDFLCVKKVHQFEKDFQQQ